MGYAPGVEHRCPVCGGEFIPTAEWAYKKRDRIYFCKWSCMRKWEEEHGKPNRRPPDNNSEGGERYQALQSVH